MTTTKSNRSRNRCSIALLLALALALAAVPCAAAPTDETAPSRWTISWELTAPAWLQVATEQVSTLWQRLRTGIDPNGRTTLVPVTGTDGTADRSLDSLNSGPSTSL